MQHTINLQEIQAVFGAQSEGMVNAIKSCVHCGFCLPTCPTYLNLGNEMDSPHGRIVLMKSALEKTISVSESRPYIEKCLGCFSCVTTCPSGVKYGELLQPFKTQLRNEAKDGVFGSIRHKISTDVMPDPARFRLAVNLGKAAKPFSKILPGDIRNMLSILPDRLSVDIPLPQFTPAEGTRRATVALLAGCVQQVLEPSINAAAIRVLSRNGVEVVIPQTQGCCGALALHNGDEKQAKRLARNNLLAFSEVIEGNYDAMITTAAGCGSAILDYAYLLKGEPEQGQAQRLAEKCKDISVFLDELGLLPPPPLAQPLRIAYHDACHLAHAQKVTSPPRRLLEAIPHVRLVPIEQSEICCGSAGTYQFEQPQISRDLGLLKSKNIINTGCDLVATGNIGCIVQIQHYLEQSGVKLPVLHTIEIIDRAYFGQHSLNPQE